VRVVGVGAGGHAKVVIDALAGSDVEIVGLLDVRSELWGTSLLGVPIIGGDDLLVEMRGRGVTHAFVGVGSVRDVTARRAAYERVVARGLEPLTVVHPRATISAHAHLGRGATVLAGAVVAAGATCGENVLINTAAVVEHDCVLGDHVHVATGARLGGEVQVGPSAHVGMGASVRQGIRIGASAVIGAGSVVVDDVADGSVVAGVPARPLPTRR
jgi:UDP-perosamine 4-acetyltransferase